MNDFEKHHFAEFKNGIANIKHTPYAFGLYIFCEEDDLRRPTVRLNTNTYEHANAHFLESKRKVLESKRKGHTDSLLDALWTDAYWIEKTEASVGCKYISFTGDRVDEKGIFLRKQWIQELGLWFEDSFEETNFEESLDIGVKIVDHYYDLCVRLARYLHPFIANKFNTELPIIIFNRECPNDESIELTFLANPSYLLEGYITYIRACCDEESAKFLEQNVDKTNLTYALLKEKRFKKIFNSSQNGG